MAQLAIDLSEKVPGALGLSTVYGDPVTVDGTTLIPVAVTSYGFGAGEGAPGATEGSGGGGGGSSWPVGAYISRGGNMRFEPNLITLLVVGIPFVCVAGRTLARIIRALKR